MSAPRPEVQVACWCFCFIHISFFLRKDLPHLSSWDTLLPNQILLDNQTLISAGKMFELSFFSPPNSAKRYLGVRFHSLPEKRPVWVANRENPLNSSSGILQLSADGDLILSENNTVIWSTGELDVTNAQVQLLDTGNLVLTSGSYGIIFWQSFDYPSDIFLPGMKIGIFYIPAYHITRLVSWRNASDPSPGDYYWKMDMRGLPECLILHNSTIIYRTGPWNGNGWSGIPNMVPDTNSTFHFEYSSSQDEVYYSYVNANGAPSQTIINGSSGELQRYVWLENNSDWSLFWKVPGEDCDTYSFCGANALCSTAYFPRCQCLQGFIPKSLDNWNKQKHEGCVRKTSLNCSSDGFWQLPNIKLPDTLNATVDANKTIDDCRNWCFSNCSCIAYAIIKIGGCITWSDDLVDIAQFTPDEGADVLFLRLAATDIPPPDIATSGGNNSKKIVDAVIPALLGSLFIILLGLFFWRRGIVPKRGSMVFQYDFPTIRDATKNFLKDNILGKGGCSIVYKGQLRNGQHIAVKRLLRNSWQGPNEFKNELELIANLQHRSLVRLLGCCTEGDERMLILEYMENKSLDTFIYDKARNSTLTWQRRMDIIMGIARGLQYLHEDSYLNIVHRDLKPSNILLDGEMNPKISDFGVSRNFQRENRSCVTDFPAGTIGYMAPEYSNAGIFSTKSDVFSFGVIVLEILTGRRNLMVNLGDTTTNLIGHIYMLWKADRALDILDEALNGSYHRAEAWRCIQIALLCVENDSSERPTMYEVCVMLSNKFEELKQPINPNTIVANIPREGDLTSNGELTNTLTGR